jgi:spermidine synthase
MLGLGLGAYLGGKYVGVLSERLRVHAIVLYGAVELVIGAGALAVPALFTASARPLLRLGETNSWSYLAASGACIAVSVLPFSLAMGATYPVALRFLEQLPGQGSHGFGRLYAFNTAGAFAGVLLTVYALVEVLGFHRVLQVGLCGNLSIAVVVALWAARLGRPSARMTDPPSIAPSEREGAESDRGDLTILFVTGFCSMAMEVGWVRSFAPVLDHAVYAFAFLLAAYLAGHALGASAHAATAGRGASPAREILLGATLMAASLPIVLADWEWMPFEVMRGAIALGIGSFAAALGWLTPLIVDGISRGRPRHAGLAYGANIAGCVLGPLVMGYALLPLLGPRLALVLLCIPLAGLLALSRKDLRWKLLAFSGTAGVLLAALVGRSFEEGPPLLPGEKRTLYRDYTATTIAGDVGGVKSLRVNGIGMTSLSPVTKMMAHLSFALHGSPPRKVLVICLGMGTTFRSALSWGADVTVVELVPGVARALTNFDETGAAGGATRGHIVIDDGRRFLARSAEKFDVIIIDPPPPAGQPASSLLYSVEFYQLLEQHLEPGGIVAQWWGFPFAEPIMTLGMARSVDESFPYVRLFRAIDDPAHQIGGYHFIASLAPVPPMTVAEFLDRMPAAARRDLQEWSVTDDPESEMQARLAQQLAREFRRQHTPEWERITDDRPINEYFYVRRHPWVAQLFGAKESE